MNLWNRYERTQKKEDKYLDSKLDQVKERAGEIHESSRPFGRSAIRFIAAKKHPTASAIRSNLQKVNISRSAISFFKPSGKRRISNLLR